jgi:hypothetical protein
MSIRAPEWPGGGQSSGAPGPQQGRAGGFLAKNERT